MKYTSFTGGGSHWVRNLFEMLNKSLRSFSYMMFWTNEWLIRVIAFDYKLLIWTGLRFILAYL